MRIDKLELELDPEDLNDDVKRNISNILSYFLLVIKHALREQKYEQIGRLPKFFLAKDTIDISKFDLKAWPGYEVSAKCTVQGIFLNADSCTKFMQKTSILRDFETKVSYGMREQDYFATFDSSNIDQPRRVVICEHNSKSYQVDGMTFNVTPDTHKFTKKDGREVSMTQHFLEEYDIKLQ